MKSIEEQQLEAENKRKKECLLQENKMRKLLKNSLFREYIYNILSMSGALPSQLSTEISLSSNELFFRQGVESVGRNILNELMEVDENFLSIILNEKRNSSYD